MRHSKNWQMEVTDIEMEVVNAGEQFVQLARVVFKRLNQLLGGLLPELLPIDVHKRMLGVHSPDHFIADARPTAQVGEVDLPDTTSLPHIMNQVIRASSLSNKGHGVSPHAPP